MPFISFLHSVSEGYLQGYKYNVALRKERNDKISRINRMFKKVLKLFLVWMSLSDYFLNLKTVNMILALKNCKYCIFTCKVHI